MWSAVQKFDATLVEYSVCASASFLMGNEYLMDFKTFNAVHASWLDSLAGGRPQF